MPSSPSPPAHTVGLDITDVTRWDSGLIEFLWDVKRAAITAGIAVDSAALPASARTLLGLLPDRRPPPSRRPAAASAH